MATIHIFTCSVRQQETPDPWLTSLQKDPWMMSTNLGFIRFIMWKIVERHRRMNQVHMVFDLCGMAQRCNTRKLREVLSDYLHVPEAEQPAIIQKICRMVQVAVPDLPIDVLILDQTYPPHYNHERRSMETVVHRVVKVILVPETKSSMEKVRLDSLEDAESSSSCVICSESLAEGVGVDQLINRLPCLHLYHGECIVRWLGINQSCPLCRYPMPIGEHN